MCMNFISLLKDSIHILRSDDYKVVSQEDLQKKKEEIARSVCSEIACGSISLTQGVFITPQEQEGTRKEVLAYKF